MPGLLFMADTPFSRFCSLVFGPTFSAGQVGEALGVSRDTIRSWLKAEEMPKGRAILHYSIRLTRASELIPHHEMTDEEIERVLAQSHLMKRGPTS